MSPIRKKQQEIKSPLVYVRYCALGGHPVRLPVKTITEKRQLEFARRLNMEIRPSSPVCGVCYDMLVKIFDEKYKRAIEHAKNRRAANSMSGVVTSQFLHSQTTYRAALESSSTSSTTSTRSDQQLPTTSSSAGQRPPQQTSDDDEPLLSLNAVNGTRLPNIQPIPKRRQFVHINKDIMDIYLAGTTGG